MSSKHHLRELEEKYEDYKVYDRNGDKIGKVDDLFIDETDREEYIGVKMGFFGLKSTLIPMEVVRVNEADRRIEVSETKDFVKGAPTFNDDDEIDASFEQNIRRHFNLESGASSGGRGSYAGAPSETTSEQPQRGTEERSDGPDSTESRGSESTQREGVTTSESTGLGSSGSRSSGTESSGSASSGTESAGLRSSGTESSGSESSSSGSSGSGSSGSGSSMPGSSGSGREVYTTESDREASRGAEEQFGGSVGEPGSTEFRNMEEMQRADREGAPREVSEAYSEALRDEEAAQQGSSQEESSQEGGRPRVRRRIITEEIFEEPSDSQR